MKRYFIHNKRFFEPFLDRTVSFVSIEHNKVTSHFKNGNHIIWKEMNENNTPVRGDIILDGIRSGLYPWKEIREEELPLI